MPTEEIFTELLKRADVYENSELKIHIVSNEYLNDSCLVVTVYQHGLKPKGVTKIESEFLFKKMKVYTYHEELDYWVPDSFFKQFLIKSELGNVNFYELNQLYGHYSDSTNQLLDSASIITPEDIF